MIVDSAPRHCGVCAINPQLSEGNMRVFLIVILAVVAAGVWTQSSAGPKTCSKKFVAEWDARNCGPRGRETDMPSPKEPCIMRRPDGRGQYLCDNSGCGRI